MTNANRLPNSLLVIECARVYYIERGMSTGPAVGFLIYLGSWCGLSETYIERQDQARTSTGSWRPIFQPLMTCVGFSNLLAHILGTGAQRNYL